MSIFTSFYKHVLLENLLFNNKIISKKKKVEFQADYFKKILIVVDRVFR